MTAVAFNPVEFREIYPQFADMTAAQLGFAFETACLVVNNSPRAVVPYDPAAGVTARKTILYLLVCHLCELRVRGNSLVGSVTNAAQGSVTAAFAAPANPGAQWFNQTQCGATAWQMLMGFLMGGKLYNGCLR